MGAMPLDLQSEYRGAWSHGFVVQEVDGLRGQVFHLLIHHRRGLGRRHIHIPALQLPHLSSIVSRHSIASRFGYMRASRGKNSGLPSSSVST